MIPRSDQRLTSEVLVQLTLYDITQCNASPSLAILTLPATSTAPIAWNEAAQSHWWHMGIDYRILTKQVIRISPITALFARGATVMYDYASVHYEFYAQMNNVTDHVLQGRRGAVTVVSQMALSFAGRYYG